MADATVSTSPTVKSPPPKPKAGPVEVKDGVREVVETVVFVVVLVLLLKTFVAEAFVIPTGSMAETLWGYQKVVTCPECKFTFPVNCADEVEGVNGKPQNRVPVTSCTCPNCRFTFEFKTWELNPACNTGDRVLVAKFLNDSGLLDFKQHDVVVFKFPEEPQQNHTQTNYIKRLIGLPNKTIGIYYGNIYEADLNYAHLDENPPNDFQDSFVKAADKSDIRRQMHKNEKSALELLTAAKPPPAGQNPAFRIVRKDPERILALRRPVFDNDHQPRDCPQRWAAEEEVKQLDAGKELYVQQRSEANKVAAWEAEASGQGFRHAAREGELAWLRYRHLVVSRSKGDPMPDKDKVKPQLIVDFMGYNSGFPSRNPNPPHYWVGDLLVEAELVVVQAKGQVVLELSKGVDRFQARFQLENGTCTLIRRDGSGDHELGSASTRISKPGTYAVRFANFDERLTLWVDGALPFGDGVAYPTAIEIKEGVECLARGPTKENDLDPVGIGVRAGDVYVRHLKLWRDTYYTLGGNDSESHDWDDSSDWNKLQHLDAMTLYVQPGHFLCLGDNSAASSDSRVWGLVPRDLMLGRAMMIYYPFMLPWPISTPVNRVGLIK